jgi:hypothetical protein
MPKTPDIPSEKGVYVRCQIITIATHALSLYWMVHFPLLPSITISCKFTCYLFLIFWMNNDICMKSHLRTFQKFLMQQPKSLRLLWSRLHPITVLRLVKSPESLLPMLCLLFNFQLHRGMAIISKMVVAAFADNFMIRLIVLPH